MKTCQITCVVSAAVFCFPAIALGQKSVLAESINNRDREMWEAALEIWSWAEPGYQESKSSGLLMTKLDRAGFQLKRGVADIPTAFTATFGSGKPVIGILGEYDALPGLSQEPVPYKLPRDDAPSNYGHACGHHLFGVASAAAAIAISEQIKAGQITGTIRFYGCPAEEGGGAKVFMVAAGLFDDCDAVLHWHPSSKNQGGDVSTIARIAAKFRFRGKAAHASSAPDQGRSSLDAVELTNHAAQLLREHTPDETRIHHVITAGGGAPNVVPDFAEVYYYVRHPKGEVAREVYRRLELCARAGALATETKLEIDYQGGIREILANDTLAKVSLENLRALNNLQYDENDLKFAARIQPTLNEKPALDEIERVFDGRRSGGRGSTDVGDISWVVPTTGFTTACWVPGTPAHSWQAVAAGATPIGRKGMNLAARVLAATAWDLFDQPEILKTAKAELEQRLGKKSYESLMRPKQKPPLDYRKPSIR